MPKWVPLTEVAELAGPLDAPSAPRGETPQAKLVGPSPALEGPPWPASKVALGVAGVLVALVGIYIVLQTRSAAMDACKSLERTKDFYGCAPHNVSGDERCPDQVMFSFKTKQGADARGIVSACGSDKEYHEALDNLVLHDTNGGELPPWDVSPARRIIVYYGPESETRLRPEQLNAIDVALGEKPFRPVHSAACDAKGSCKSIGHCSVEPGHEDNCLAGSDDDCRQSNVCAQYGLCKLGANGLCAQ
jgi:hypothetical protein